jgi:hypothetical protein
MAMESRQDVIHWMMILNEHHLAHVAHDKQPPLFIHVDPAEMVQAIRALSREGFGLPPVVADAPETINE